MQRRIYGHATGGEIRPLNEEKAVQAAVDLIGEIFIFTVFIFLLFLKRQMSRWFEKYLIIGLKIWITL